MSWQLIISAMAMGLLSSFHCVGMCGPIAFSLPSQNLSPAKKTLGILAYNGGRIVTYSLLGVVFGLIGRQLWISGLQQWFSIVAGIFILVILLQSLAGRPFLHLPGFWRVSQWVQNLIGKFILKPTIQGKLMLGMANGLLPCGLVYLAITGALAAGTVEGAAAFMAAFGLGTVPAMFLLSYFGFLIKVSTRNTIKKAVPYFVGLVGVLLILRGLNLNIPFVSPVIGSAIADTVSCH